MARPSSLRSKRQPSLAVAAREADVARRRELNRTKPGRLWARRIMGLIALLFASMSLFGSAAQAADWPWEATKNAVSTVMNICRPNDVPMPISEGGPDSDTVVPQFAQPANSGNGIQRLEEGFRVAQVGDAGNVKNALSTVAGVKDNGYERYGYSTLKWDNYGSTCFVGPGQLLTGPANGLFVVLVTGPAILLTAFINFALNNVFYDLFFSFVSPFMQLFANIFAPWVLMIVLIGGSVMILIRSKGSMARILQMSCWMIAILAIFFGIQSQGLGAQITRLANNAVTQAVNLVACQVSTANIGGQNLTQGGPTCGIQGATAPIANFDINKKASSQQVGQFQITGGISQSIWYSIPYQVWSQGTVGSAQYQVDQSRTDGGQLSWSAAILNAKHINPDDSLGKSVQNYSNLWNQAGYSVTGDNGGEKMRIWTEPQKKGWKDENDQPDTRAWNGVPYLGVVKAMCNDVAPGTEKSEDLDLNNWMYQGQCDAAGADVNFLPAFKGDQFWERGAAIVSGSAAIFATGLPLIGVSLYVMVQKMLFFFILMFAPIFLAIGAFPDEKRMGFAKRYGELFVANLVKQVVAVCVLLFIMTGVSGVLRSDTIWWMKPFGVVMFTFALILFAIPLSRILKAAVKGDVSAVDKTLQAPQRVAKTTAKVAGVVGIAGATMGIGALAAGAAATAGAGTGAGAVASGAGARAGFAALGNAAKGAATGGTKTGAAGAVAAAKGTLAKPFTGVKSGGLQGAAGNLTKMVKNGDALKMLRYSGLADSGLGQTLRKGLGLGQVGLNMAAKSAATGDPAVQAGLAAARAEGIGSLDRADRMSSNPQYQRDASGRLTGQGIQQAEADYDKYFDGDSEGRKAEKNKNDTLNMLHSNYTRMTGGFLPSDPKHPDNQSSGVVPTPEQTAEDIAGSMSPSSWSAQVVKNQVKDGSTLLANAGGVEALLSGENSVSALSKLYEGYGSMANIDPTHPAAAGLINLGFAAASDDPQYQEAALADVAALLSEHGAPDRISGFHASPEFAAGYTPATLLSSMPVLTDASTMAERADAAGIFTIGAMTLPETSPHLGAVNAYRAALLDPGASAAQVNELKSALANGVLSADPASFLHASDAFVTDSQGQTGFSINGDSSLDWSDARPSMPLPAYSPAGKDVAIAERPVGPEQFAQARQEAVEHTVTHGASAATPSAADSSPASPASPASVPAITTPETPATSPSGPGASPVAPEPTIAADSTPQVPTPVVLHQAAPERSALPSDEGRPTATSEVSDRAPREAPEQAHTPTSSPTAEAVTQPAPANRQPVQRAPGLSNWFSDPLTSVEAPDAAIKDALAQHKTEIIDEVRAMSENTEKSTTQGDQTVDLAFRKAPKGRRSSGLFTSEEDPDEPNA